MNPLQSHLPDHDTSIPSLSRCLVHAASQGRRVNEAVTSIARIRRFTNHNLVERNTTCGDLEHGRLRPCARRLGQQAGAGSVLGRSLYSDDVKSYKSGGQIQERRTVVELNMVRKMSNIPWF